MLRNLFVPALLLFPLCLGFEHWPQPLRQLEALEIRQVPPPELVVDDPDDSVVTGADTSSFDDGEGETILLANFVAVVAIE
jgi:hypothetical protein